MDHTTELLFLGLEHCLSFAGAFLGRKLFEEKACFVNLDETFQSTTNQMVMRYRADADLPFNSLAVYYWHGKICLRFGD